LKSLRIFLVLGLAFASVVPTGTSHATEPAAQGAPADVSRIIASVEKKYADVHTIQAAFTQSKSDAFGKVEQDGDVVLQRPTRMRWRFTTGEQSEFVTDGGTLWIYTKADNQVLRMTDTSQATNTANAFLTSLDSLDEMFVVTLVAQDAGPTLDLVPREATMYKRIRLSLDPSLVLRAVVFTDVYDNVTDLRFRDVKLNGPVDPSIFTFVAPAGAAVIDN
jgi:outer membrane lipoprotein carrier protein